MRREKTLRGLLAVVVLGGMLGTTVAHDGMTGIVGERMAGMINMSRSLKALSETLDTASPDVSVVRNAAQAFQEHAGSAMTGLFPEGSIEGMSEAAPTIWENWGEFSRLAAYLKELGEELAVAVGAGAATAVRRAPPPAASSQNAESLWASLDERALLGLDPVFVPASERAVPREVGRRPVRETFAAIAQTCADCHAKFRRGKQ